LQGYYNKFLIFLFGVFYAQMVDVH
jgi:hypothetical protein